MLGLVVWEIRVAYFGQVGGAVEKSGLKRSAQMSSDRPFGPSCRASQRYNSDPDYLCTAIAGIWLRSQSMTIPRAIPSAAFLPYKSSAR